jgi:hypothetical protein
MVENSLPRRDNACKGHVPTTRLGRVIVFAMVSGNTGDYDREKDADGVTGNI